MEQKGLRAGKLAQWVGLTKQGRDTVGQRQGQGMRKYSGTHCCGRRGSRFGQQVKMGGGRRHSRDHRAGTKAVWEWVLAPPGAQQQVSQAKPMESGERPFWRNEKRYQMSTMQLHRTCRHEGLHPGLSACSEVWSGHLCMSPEVLAPERAWQPWMVVRDRWEPLAAWHDYCVGVVLGHL